PGKREESGVAVRGGDTCCTVFPGESICRRTPTVNGRPQCPQNRACSRFSFPHYTQYFMRSGNDCFIWGSCVARRKTLACQQVRCAAVPTAIARFPPRSRVCVRLLPPCSSLCKRVA